MVGAPMKHVAFAVALASTLVTNAARAGQSHVCQEVSDVTGDRKCGRFGDRWAAERTVAGFVGIGTFSGIVQPGGKPFSGTVGKDAATTYSFDGGRFVDGPLRSYGLDLRVGGYLTDRMYLGWEWALGLGRARAAAMESNGYTITPSSGANFFQGRFGPLVGARVPLGVVSLRLESLVGVQALWLSHQASRPDGSVKNASVTNIAIVIEPRVALDWWAWPDTTLSLWTGTNALRPGDVTFGVALTAHGRPFDGRFR